MSDYFRLDWNEYTYSLYGYYPTLDEALAMVRTLVAPHPIVKVVSLGMPTLLTAPNGKAVGRDVLWDYGAAFAFGRSAADPTHATIAGELGVIEGVVA